MLLMPCSNQQGCNAPLSAGEHHKLELKWEDYLLACQSHEITVPTLLLHTSLIGEVTEPKQLRENNQSQQIE